MFVVYHTETIRIHASCKTEAGAKRSCTKINKKRGGYAWNTRAYYDESINTMTTTYNMLDPTHKEIPIRLADKGGCCDPATETYHSM